MPKLLEPEPVNTGVGIRKFMINCKGYYPLYFSLFIPFFSFSLAQAEPLIVEGSLEKISPDLGEHYYVRLVDEDKLQDSLHFEDLLTSEPGLSTTGGTARPRFFQIRGIGERSAYEGMPNESVTIIFDSIDYTGVGGILDTFSLEKLEIYKGPQNTVIGPSSLAGMVRAESKYRRKTKNHYSASLQSFNGKALQYSHINRLKNFETNSIFSFKQDSGYFKNTYLNRDDTNGRDEFSFRQKFKSSQLELNLHFFDFNSGYDAFNFKNNKETRSDRPGQDNQRTFGLSLTKDHQLSNATLKTILSGHSTDSLYSYDEDWGNNSDWLNLANWNKAYDYRIQFSRVLKNINLEERLQWNTKNTYHTTGLFFKNNHLSVRETGFNKEVIRKDLKSTFKRKRLAIYHESEFFLSRNFSLIGGLRASYLDSLYYDTNNKVFSPQDRLWGGHIALKKENKDHLFTLKLSRGFKAGGINIGNSIDESRQQFDDEKLYSLNISFERLKRNLKLKGDLFIQIRKDIQVKTSYQDNPSDPSSFTFYTDNATSGKSFGLEGSVEYKTDKKGHYLILNGLLMKSQYGNYLYGNRNLKGRSFAQAPSNSISLRHGLNFTPSLLLELSHTRIGSFYFGNSHDERSPNTLTTDIKLAYKQSQRNLTLTLFAKNLFQERTEQRGFYFGNRPPNFSNERFVLVGPPRTLGLKLDYSY